MWITLHFNESTTTKQWQSITSLITQWLCFSDVDYMFWLMNEYIMISLIGTCMVVNSCHIHSNVVILSTILIINTNVLSTYRMFAYSIEWKLVGKVCGNFHSNFRPSKMANNAEIFLGHIIILVASKQSIKKTTS
jgi:hypothetical protein